MNIEFNCVIFNLMFLRDQLIGNYNNNKIFYNKIYMTRLLFFIFMFSIRYKYILKMNLYFKLKV